MEVEILTDHLY